MMCKPDSWHYLARDSHLVYRNVFYEDYSNALLEYVEAMARLSQRSRSARLRTSAARALAKAREAEYGKSFRTRHNGVIYSLTPWYFTPDNSWPDFAPDDS